MIYSQTTWEAKYLLYMKDNYSNSGSIHSVNKVLGTGSKCMVTVWVVTVVESKLEEQKR
jgi:hypothetical protein